MFKFKTYFHDGVLHKFSLARDIKSAIAHCNASTLRNLHAEHGEIAFAQALSELPASTIADALSVLAFGDRPGVQSSLTPIAQRRLETFLDIIDHAAPPHAPRGNAVLVWTRPH